MKTMNIKKIHYISGLIITSFVGLHLLNHSYSLLGAEKHIEVMNILRSVYRNLFLEIVLLLAIVIQIYSGLKLFLVKRKIVNSYFERIHIWSGLYLAFFFVIHLSAVFAGRFVLKLDTNFYFGVAGLNSFPFNLFFIPYYSLAVISFFAHISAVHHQKMKYSLLGLTPHNQSILILVMGICFVLILMYGLTNKFQGFEIPEAYRVLIGK